MGRELVILSPVERRDTLLHVIRRARHRLTFSLFRCDDRKVLNELAEARDRGVRVEALVTPSAKGWEKRLKDLRGLLHDLGAEVHRYDGGNAKYHAKYMVADDSTAVVASLNFTQKCFSDTCDFLLVSHDPGLISSLRRLFKADCRAAGSPFPRNLSERLIVGPEQARRRIETLIQGAKRRIRIMDHRMADPDMLALLRARRKAGVNVEVLDEREIGGLRAHGKMMLIDDNVAVLGSLSLSSSSLNNRREVAVIVRQPEVVGRLAKFFEERKALR
jgi:cardiolipin synthase